MLLTTLVVGETAPSTTLGTMILSVVHFNLDALIKEICMGNRYFDTT